MKKIKKVILVSSVLTATVGCVGLANILPKALQKNNKSSYIQPYKHNPDNILDNVFENDGIIILPFIFENSDQTVTKEYVLEHFRKAGIEVTNEADLADIITTGTQIKTPSKTYTVIVYGDADGDGYADSYDALAIIEHVVNGGDKEIKGTYKIAANVENDDEEVDSYDALRIIEFVVGTEPKLVLNEPVSIKEGDDQAPKITLNGDNPQIIRLGQPYVELGATVTDNADENPKVVVDSSEVKTDKMGTYNVTYKAEDASGNKSEEIREVNVVDYITNVEITLPTKTSYDYGEEINLNGGQIKVDWKSGDTSTSRIDKAMVQGYNPNKFGTQEVTILYETTNTVDGQKMSVEKKYNVTVIDHITITKPDNLTKYRYDNFEIAQLVPDKAQEINLTWSIKDIAGNTIEDDLVAEVTVPPVQDGVTKMNFTATQVGTYYVTPIIDGVEREAIEVTIKDDLTINKIELVVDGDIRAKEEKVAQIKFMHAYNKGTPAEDTVEVDVPIKDVKEPTSNIAGIDLELLDSAKGSIDRDTEPLKPVKHISITSPVSATASDNKTISIEVEGKNEEETAYTYTENIKLIILAETKPEVKVRGLTGTTGTINLYSSDPGTVADKINKDNPNEIYTLVPIYLSKGNEEIAINAGDVINDTTGGIPEGKVAVIDNVIDNDPNEFAVIKDLKFYNEAGTEIKRSDGNFETTPIYYVGIALDPSEDSSTLTYIKIKYGTSEIKLDATVK